MENVLALQLFESDSNLPCLNSGVSCDSTVSCPSQTSGAGPGPIKPPNEN